MKLHIQASIFTDVFGDSVCGKNIVYFFKNICSLDNILLLVKLQQDSAWLKVR